MVRVPFPTARGATGTLDLWALARELAKAAFCANELPLSDLRLADDTHGAASKRALQPRQSQPLSHILPHLL